MKKTTAAAALFLALSSMAMSPANADVIYYFTGSNVYNGPAVQDTNYFATATFSDVTVNNKGTKTTYVNLVMSVLAGLDAGAYVNDWAFNSNNTISAVTYSGGTTGKEADKVVFGDNVVNNFGGTGGDFDLKFNFSTDSPGQLAVGATSTYQITGTGLTAASFASLSANTDTPFSSAVHVQGGVLASSFYSGTTTKPPVVIVGPGGEPLPEPTTVALLGLGLLGFAASRRKAAKSKNA